jgi:hypothetical protein
VPGGAGNCVSSAAIVFATGARTLAQFAKRRSLAGRVDEAGAAAAERLAEQAPVNPVTIATHRP